MSARKKTIPGCGCACKCNGCCCKCKYKEIAEILDNDIRDSWWAHGWQATVYKLFCGCNRPPATKGQTLLESARVNALALVQLAQEHKLSPRYHWAVENVYKQYFGEHATMPTRLQFLLQNLPQSE